MNISCMKNYYSLTFLLFFLVSSCFKLDDDGQDLDQSTTVDPPTTPVVDPPSSDNVPIMSGERVPCVEGLAGDYPCSNYNLLNHITLSDMGTTLINDNWGWEDPDTGIAYVLQGMNNGVAFLDISSPTAVRYVGKLPTATDDSTWRDIKVYSNHAYIVSEAADHGLQVFDLTRLRDQTAFQTFEPDYVFKGFGSAHNVAINETSGFAYVIGARKGNGAYYAGGPVFFDLSNPARPLQVGGYSESSYTHDAHIVSYLGPDADHQGREILFGSNSDGGENNKLIVLDVTDKENPILIASKTYGNGGYTHQGWVDENQRFFYLGDELDEIRYGHRTKTLVFDMQNLDEPILHHTYEGPTYAIDHNGYTFGDRYYISNYTAGLRVVDISGIADGQMEEVGHFDTYPASDGTGFAGVWNVYPFFESGIIAISDSDNGLFLVRPKN